MIPPEIQQTLREALETWSDMLERRANTVERHGVAGTTYRKHIAEIGVALQWLDALPTTQHRNGETEPPQVAGWYWFTGSFTSNPDSKWSHVLFLEEINGKIATDICMDIVDPITELEGRWWGPIEPPVATE